MEQGEDRRQKKASKHKERQTEANTTEMKQWFKNSHLRKPKVHYCCGMKGQDKY